MGKTQLGAKFLFILLALALPLPILSAACPVSQSTVLLGAVVGENSGGVFSLHVSVRPGSGNVYTSISPLIGYSTQESEQQAVDYAFASTGMDKSECDVTFAIDGDFGENRVDGPSAGAAMAMATRAALLGKKVRQDVVVTGTISPGGGVGEVGGVLEKSIGAKDAGARYVLVPSLKIYESLLLASLPGAGSFAAIEVEDIESAERILFSNESEQFSSDFSPQSKPLPVFLPAQKYDADLGRFSLVAKNVVDELNATADNVFAIAPEGSQTEALRKYFSDEIAKDNALISMGYPFTAANAAFLLSIDAQYVRMGEKPASVDDGFSMVAGCLDSLPAAAKTRENFHWAVGADLRRIWAQNKLNQSGEMRAEQGGYITLRDLFYAYSWCKISGELSSQASDIGGTPVDESLLAAIADKKLTEASDLLSSSQALNYDALWHLNNGATANESGNYGAAIYEATYALSMQRSANDAEGGNISASVEKLQSEERASLWGKIYQGQGRFLYYSDKEGNFPQDDAYDIMRYSSELDSASSEIDSALSSPAGAQASGTAFPPIYPSAPGGEQNLLVAFVLSVYVVGLGAAILWRLRELNKR